MVRWLKKLLTQSIRRQLILGIALVHAVLMTIFVTDMVLRQRDFLQRQSLQNTESLALTLATNSISWVLADDVIGLEELVMSQADLPDLLYVMILAPDGRVLGHSDNTKVGRYVSDDVSLSLLTTSPEPCHLVVNRQMVDIAVPITANERHIGWARVAVSQQSINDGLRVITRDGVFYTLLAIFVGSIFAVMMSRGITRGLHHLVWVAERLKIGDNQARSNLDRPDELGTLGRTLNDMIDAVAEEKERLRVTLYSIADGVITADIDGRVVLVNQVAENLLGVCQDEAAGRYLADVFRATCDEKGTPCESMVKTVLAGGTFRQVTGDIYLRGRENRLHTIAQNCAPIRDSHNRIIGVVLVVRDVTEEKQMRDQIFKAKSLESLGLLAGGIAHDFNNILTSILGNVNLAATCVEPGSEVSELLDHAESASFRARDLTRQLLTFAKGGDPVRESHSLADVIRDTSAFVLSGSNVRCEFQFQEGLFPVYIDKGQISQVVQNLIINASQAMPGGGIVTVKATNSPGDGGRREVPEAGNCVKLEISDTGVGIAEDSVNRIFDPYFSTKQTGTGLGLAVTHSIIAKHHGHIAVTSLSGVGTTFTIYLPASTEAPVADDAKVPELNVGRGTILVVDDEALVQRTLSRMLTATGYKVRLVRDGAEALSVYMAARGGEHPIDLVLTDLTIPGGVGGQETAALILARDPQAKLIVSSGYSNDPVMANYAAYGFAGCLCKPYTRDELLRVVQDVLED